MKKNAVEVLKNIENFKEYINYCGVKVKWNYDDTDDSFLIDGDIDIFIKTINSYKDGTFYVDIPFDVRNCQVYSVCPSLELCDKIMDNDSKIWLKEFFIMNPEYLPNVADSILDLSHCIVDLRKIHTEPTVDTSLLKLNKKSFPKFEEIQNLEEFKNALPKNLLQFSRIEIHELSNYRAYYNYDDGLVGLYSNTVDQGFKFQTKYYKPQASFCKPLYITNGEVIYGNVNDITNKYYRLWDLGDYANYIIGRKSK